MFEVGRLEGHESQITTIAFTSDGCKIISASDDMAILLWEVDGAQQDGQAYRVVTYYGDIGCNSKRRGGAGFASNDIFSLLFSSNGEQLAMGIWAEDTRPGEDTTEHFDFWTPMGLP